MTSFPALQRRVFLSKVRAEARRMKKEPQEIVGKVVAVLAAMTPGSIVSMAKKKICAVRGHGIANDAHAGTRLLDVRERVLLRHGLLKGMEIANHREFSAVSAEDLIEIGASLGLGMSVPFGHLGENLVLSGIPNLSTLPSGTLLCFRKNAYTPRTAVLAVWGENHPCILPGEALQSFFPDKPDIAKQFVKHALGKRGVVGNVYCSGDIHAGDQVVAYIPEQRVYEPLPKIQPGIWRHFKGKEYLVEGEYPDTESSIPHVAYRQLYAPYERCSRTKENFLEHVDRPEQAYTGPRFVLIKAF